MMNYKIYNSPLGSIHLYSDGTAITGLYLQNQLQQFPVKAVESNADPAIKEAILWLDAYFSGMQPSPDNLPLRPSGSAFQQRIWQLLLRIPYGQTVTYGQLAKQLSGSMSAQAVGQAVGKNPISIIIPCHRVLGTNNRLTGYAGGIEYKVALLKHEGLDDTAFIYPKNYRGK